MDNSNKYRRWAWGAVIGLGIVIVISGIIMAMTLSAPKPNEETISSNTKTETTKNEKTTEESKKDDQPKEEDKKTETQPEATANATADSSSQKQSQSGSSDGVMRVDEKIANANSIPKTGPEEFVIPVVGLSICGYLFAYNVQLFKKNA